MGGAAPGASAGRGQVKAGRAPCGDCEAERGTGERAPEEAQGIERGLGRDAAVVDAANTLGASQLPPDVMRAFPVKYPHVMPAGAALGGPHFELASPPADPPPPATLAPTRALLGVP